MMELEAVKKKLAGWSRRLGTYKYVLLVIAAGVVLLLWPGPADDEPSAQTDRKEETFSVADMEAQLEEILSRIEGAGQVSVMLTVKSGMERVLAQDGTLSAEEESIQTVVISTGSGSEEVVVLKQYYPTFQGALVVCSGGGDAQVQLLITQAVSALTGLSAARISVCQGG